MKALSFLSAISLLVSFLTPVATAMAAPAPATFPAAPAADVLPAWMSRPSERQSPAPSSAGLLPAWMGGPASAGTAASNPAALLPAWLEAPTLPAPPAAPANAPLRVVLSPAGLSVSGPATANVCDTITYTVVFTNNATPATHVMVTSTMHTPYAPSPQTCGPYSMAANEVRTCTFAFAGGCAAVSGQNIVTLTQDGVIDPIVRYTDLVVNPGAIIVRKEPAVQPALLGDVVTWTVSVENTGYGDVTNVAITDVLGSGLSHLSGLTTAFIPQMSAGQVLTFPVSARVDGCFDLTNAVTGTWGCAAGQSCLTPQTASAAIDLQMRNPDLNYTLPTFDVPFCAGLQTFTVPITNNGDGVAYSTTLTTDLSPFTVTLAPGVTYSGGAFHLPPIDPGDTYNLVFTLTLPADVCTMPDGGNFNFDIVYYDRCNHPYYEMPQRAGWRLIDVPGEVSLNKTMPAEVYRGQQVIATIDVDVSGITPPAIVTDTVPPGWTVVDAGGGHTFTMGSTTYITWEVTASGTFTVVLQTPGDTLDGCAACGTQATNAVAVWATDCQNCVREATASAITYIQCDDGISSDKQVSAPIIPCSLDTLTYTNTYNFGASFSVTPTWGGLIFTETLLNQTYVTGTARVWVSNGALSCDAVFSESIVAGQLVITNISPPCAPPLPGATMRITYQTRVSDTVPSCSDFSWYDWSYLNLGVTGNAACAYYGVLQEGVFVGTLAPQMTLHLDGLPSTISECGAYTVTLTAERTTPGVGAYDAVIDLVTDTFAVLTVLGFDGATPVFTETDNNGYHWYYSDTFATELTATVRLAVQLRCTTAAPFSATLRYDNFCANNDIYRERCSTGGNLANPLVAPCAPILTKFPEVIYAAGDVVRWTLTVFNSGAGAAYNVTLTDTLGSGLRYVSSTITSTQGSAASVTPLTSARYVTWTLPVIQPKERVTIHYDAEIVSCDDLTNVFGGQQGCLGQACRSGCAETARVELPPTLLLNTNQFISPIDTCYTRTVTVTVRNAGRLSVYTATVQETLPPGLNYVTGTTEVSTDTVHWQAGPDPSISGGQLHWGPTSGAPLTDWLVRIRPYETVYIRFQTTASCAFDGGQIAVQTSYQDPCGKSLSSLTSSYLMQSRRPALTFTKVGQHVTRTHPVDLVYAEPGETVVWTITVANAGSASPATNVTVSDTLPSNAVYQSATPGYNLVPPPGGAPGGVVTWTLGTLNPGQTVALTISTVISTPEGCTAIDTRNNAYLLWGCDDGCRVPMAAYADLRTRPVFDDPALATGIPPHTINQCGGALTVTLVNNGPPAYNVVLTDTLPTGFVYSDTVSASTTPASYPNDGDTVAIWTWNELPSGETTLVFRVRNERSAGNDCVLPSGNNRIVVRYDDDALDCLITGPYFVTATQTLDVRYPVLRIEKTPPSQTVDVGEPVAWTLTVRNIGSVVAYNVVVTDIVGTNYVSVAAGAGSDGSAPISATIAAGTLITWYPNDIPPGGVWTVTVTAVLTDVGENINRAWVLGGCDTGCVTSSHDDSAHTTLLEEFSKQPGIQTGTVGSLVVFHLSAALSDWDAVYTNLTLTDTLPAGLGYVSAVLTYTHDLDSSNGGPFGPTMVGPSSAPTPYNTGNVVWNLGNLSGTLRINGVITAVIRDIPANYNGARLTNLFRMTYTDEGVPYHYEDTADVAVLEPLLHIGKTYVTPSGCAATLFADNFNRTPPIAPWTGGTAGSWTLSNGTIRNATNTTNQRVYAGNAAWTDYSYSAMMMSTDTTGDMGLIFRAQGLANDQNYYRFRWNRNNTTGSYRLERVVNGTATSLGAAVNTRYETNRWYHVEIQATGNRFRVYIDGALVLDRTDSQFPAGRIGLYANNQDAVYFDDVLVTRMDDMACYVGANDLVTYTLTISNQAQLPGYDLVITDVIPAGMSFVTSTFASSDPTANVIYTPAVGATGVLTWGVDHLNPTMPFAPLNHTSITLTVVLRVNDGITANVTLANQAFLSYDGQEGNGPVGIERDYSGGSHSTAVRTVNRGIAKTVQFAPPPTATLGTLVTYTLIVPATPISATLYNVVVTDTLDSRLFIEDVTFSGGTGGAAAWAARLVTGTFASIPHDTQVYITVTARISHEWPSAAGDANAGDVITNAAQMSHATAPVTTSNEVSTTVGEPRVAIVKSVESSTGALTGLDGAAFLTYTLRLENTGDSPAYSLYITDTLPEGISVTALYGGDAHGAPVAGPDVLTWTVGTLSNEPPDNVLVLSYTARLNVDFGALTPTIAGLTLTNVVDLLYHSLTDTIPGVRPYTDTDTADVGVALPTIEKTTTPPVLRVGDLVTYNLVFTIPAGTVGMGGDSYLRDVLLPGLWYITDTEVLTWSPASVAPITFTNRVLTVTASHHTIIWYFGQPITSEQDVPTVLTLTFRAQVVGLLIDDPTTVEYNDALVFWYPGNIVELWQHSQFLDRDNVTNQLIQPHLDIDKDSTPPPGSYVSGGDLITYTLTITNSGLGPAYDFIISDTLPAGLSYVTSSVASASPPTIAFIAEPAIGATGVLTWRVNELAGRCPYPTDVLCSGTGLTTTAVLTVVARVTDTIGANLALTNTAAIPYYDSQPGDGPGPYDPDEREYTNGEDSVVHYTVDASIVKAVFPTTATIGSVITYTITVPEPPIHATLYTVTVTDGLDDWLRLDTVTAPGGDVAHAGNVFTVTYDSIPAGEQRIITVTAVVIDDMGDPVAGDVITNVVTLTHDTGITTSNEVTVTVHEPRVILEKSVETPRDPLGASDLVTYSIVLTNTGDWPAYDLVISDTLPAGLTYVGEVDFDVTDPTTATTGGAYPQWTLSQLNVGGAATIRFTARVDADIAAGVTLTNAAWGEYSSQPGDDPDERVYDIPTDTVPVDVGYPALDLVKSADPDPVEAGGLLTYTLTVVNTGIVSATGVVVTDVVPLNTTYIDCGPLPCSVTGGVVSWDLGVLDIGDTHVLTMLVQVDSPLLTGTRLVNTAWVTSTEGITDTDTVTTPVSSAHTLAITKTAEPATAQAGELLTYTLAWSVSGNEPALDVTISDTIPAHTTYWDSDPAATTAPPTGGTGLVTWNLGNQDPPASGVVTLVVRVDSNVPTGTLLYNATLITDTQGLTDTDEITTPVETSAEIWVEKTGSASPVTPGLPMTYSLTVHNAGPSVAENVVVTDTLPPEVAFVTASPVPDSAPDPLVWELGTLDAGASREIVITVTVNASVTAGFTNTVVITTSTPGDDPGNNEDDWPVDVLPDVEIWVEKTGNASPVTPGLPMTYSLTVHNDGPSNAENVVVTDTLPPEVAFVDANPPQASGPDPLVWNLGTLAAGASREIVITVTVNASVTAGFTNTVVITTSTPGDDPGNNEDDHPVDVQPNADLAITKSDHPDPVVPGETLVYTLVYTNYGPSGAENVVVADTLPPEVTFVAADPTQSSGPNPLTWNLGTLAAGDSGRIVITVTVGASATDPFTNTVVITSTTPDDNPDNNQDEEPTHPLVPGLELVKTVLPGAAVPNMPFTYVITITNTGYVTLDPLVLTDTLPTLDFHYVVGSATPGEPSVIAPPLLVWPDLGPLHPGESITVTFAVTASPGISVGTYVNVALAAGDHPGGVLTDTDDVPVSIQDPAVALSKHLVAFDTDVWAPNFVTFTIAITNVGISEIDVLPLYDLYDAYYLHFAESFPPAPNTVDNVNGQTVWFDLTAPAPHGFGRNLLPGEVFSITTVFTVVNEITLPVTNTAVVSDATDIYDNPTPDEEDEEVIIDIPTAVDLLYFRAVALGEGIRLEWATAVEIDNFGFTLHRATEPDFTRASEIVFIPSACRGNLCGATYDYLDTTVDPSVVYWYWLVDVDTSGVTTRRGPVSGRVSGAALPNRIFLPLVLRNR